MNRPIIIIGAGGHARVVADAIRASGRTVLGFTDSDTSKHKTTIDDLPVLGDDTALAGQEGRIDLANGLGSIGKPELRQNIFEKFKRDGFHFAKVIHPNASVSAFAQVSDGAQIMAGAVVQAGAKIGQNVIINTGACIDHDCQIAAHSHIAPGAILSGAVFIALGCHIGPGAVLIQGISLGEGTIVGAGAVVTHSHPAGAILKGIPARART